MSNRRFTNNASTTLASGISSSATTLNVFAGTGSLFPALTTAQQYFSVTLIKNGVPTIYEIVKVTLRSTDTMTIQRAQEGTTALAWNPGDTVALLPTAAAMFNFAQIDDLQLQVTNFAIDTGAANAYAVTLSPPLTAHIVGMPIRFQAGHTNTGVSTFNDGVGTASIFQAGGQPTYPGLIVAGAIYEVYWTGTYFDLANPSGFATLLSPTLTGVPTAPTAAPGNNSTQIATTAFVATSFATIAGVAATYAPLISPALTGSPTAPTQNQGVNNTILATTAFVVSALVPKANLASPALTGVPTAPTAANTINNTQLATTAFVNTYVASVVKGGTTPVLIQGANRITFPVAFPSTCSGVVVSPMSNSATFAITGFDRLGFNMNAGAAEVFTYVATGT